MPKYLHYIMTIKLSSPERLINLKKVINWIKTLPKELNIIVTIVENNSIRQINPNDFPDSNYLFISSKNKTFSKCLSYNSGILYSLDKIGLKLEQSQDQLFCFADADCILLNKHFIESFRHLNNYQAVKPFKHTIIDVPLSQVNAFNHQNPSNIGRKRYCFSNLSGGMLFISGKAFLKVGGWPEEFYDWGGEDDAMGYRIASLLNYKWLDYPIYHLYHPVVRPTFSYNWNIHKLYKHLSMNSQEILQDSISRLKHIGTGFHQQWIKKIDLCRLSFWIQTIDIDIIKWLKIVLNPTDYILINHRGVFLNNQFKENIYSKNIFIKFFKCLNWWILSINHQELFRISNENISINNLSVLFGSDQFPSIHYYENSYNPKTFTQMYIPSQYCQSSNINVPEIKCKLNSLNKDNYTVGYFFQDNFLENSHQKMHQYITQILKTKPNIWITDFPELLYYLTPITPIIYCPNYLMQSLSINKPNWYKKIITHSESDFNKLKSGIVYSTTNQKKYPINLEQTNQLNDIDFSKYKLFILEMHSLEVFKFTKEYNNLIPTCLIKAIASGAQICTIPMIPSLQLHLPKSRIINKDNLISALDYSNYKKAFYPITNFLYSNQLERILLKYNLFLKNSINKSYLNDRVTCICITKNRFELLYRSVQCFLDQDYKNRELLIMYQKNSFKIIEKIKIKLYSKKIPKIRYYLAPDNLVLGELRNLAISNSNGRYFTQWDDDDIYDPKRISTQINFCKLNNYRGCCLNQRLLLDQVENKVYLSNVWPFEGSVLAEISLLMGKYSKESKGEETDSIFKCLKNKEIGLLNKPNLYLYLYHGANVWSQKHFQQIFNVSTYLGKQESAFRDSIFKKYLKNNSNNFPKIIHQTWKTTLLSKSFQILSERVQKMHPHWEYKLWTDSDNRNLIAEMDSDFLPIYDNFKYPIQRVDSAKYFIMKKYGGVYLDLDIFINKKLDKLIESIDGSMEIMLGVESDEAAYFHKMDKIISNALIISQPRHTLWDVIINYIKKDRQNNIINKNNIVLETTGPFMISKMYSKYKHQVKLLGSNYWSSISYLKIEEYFKNKHSNIDAFFKNSLMIHLSVGTWWKNKIEFDSEKLFLPQSEIEFLIPRIVHLSWKDEYLPDYGIRLIKQIKYFNSNWEIKLWSDKQIDEFVKNNYLKFYPTFLKFTYQIERVDFFRVLVCYHFGGIWMDLDIVLEKPIEEVIPNNIKIFFPCEKRMKSHDPMHLTRIGNYCFGSTRKNKFLIEFLEYIEMNFISSQNLNDVLESTGPGRLTKFYYHHFMEENNSSNIFILYPNIDKKTRCSCCYNEMVVPCQVGDMGYHLHKNSWKRNIPKGRQNAITLINNSIVCKTQFPKIIWITYKNNNLPVKIFKNLQKLNPNYRIEFFNDERCYQFILEHYGEYYANFFRQIPIGYLKADLWRLCILYKYGGFYIDADVEMFVGFDQILTHSIKMLTCTSSIPVNKLGLREVNPCILATESNLPIIKKNIDLYLNFNPKKTIDLYITNNLARLISVNMDIKPGINGWLHLLLEAKYKELIPNKKIHWQNDLLNFYIKDTNTDVIIGNSRYNDKYSFIKGFI